MQVHGAKRIDAWSHSMPAEVRQRQEREAREAIAREREAEILRLMEQLGVRISPSEREPDIPITPTTHVPTPTFKSNSATTTQREAQVTALVQELSLVRRLLITMPETPRAGALVQQKPTPRGVAPSKIRPTSNTPLSFPIATRPQAPTRASTLAPSRNYKAPVVQTRKSWDSTFRQSRPALSPLSAIPSRTERNPKPPPAVKEETMGPEQQRARKHELEEQKAINTLRAAWYSYQSRSNAIFGPESASNTPLTFSDIPWPQIPLPMTSGDVAKWKIADLLLSPHHSANKTNKEKVRIALQQWHPDKVGGKWMTRVVDADKQQVREGVSAVARCLTQLLAENRT